MQLAMNLIIVPGTLVFSRFLISVCMLIVSIKSSAHIEGHSDCSHRGSLWFNPFATLLFNVCSALTVECCVLYPGLVFGMFAVICQEECSSPVSLQLLK